MSLSSTFLSLVKKFSTDLDVQKLRHDVYVFAGRYPELSRDRLAEKLIDRTAAKAAAIGAVASLPPGIAAFAAMGPELSALLVLQSRLVVGLHVLYGRDPEPEERALEVLAGLASGAGMSFGRQFGARAAEEVAAKILARYATRSLGRFVPLVGVVTGGLLNYLAVKAVGKATLLRLSRGPGDRG